MTGLTRGLATGTGRINLYLSPIETMRVGVEGLVGFHDFTN